MSALEDVSQIRVLPVTARGASAGWTLLEQAIRDISPSGFIAIDTEFSGLGSDPKLEDKDLAVRYEAMRELADSRAILSLGISLFDPVQTEVADGSRDSELAPEPCESVPVRAQRTPGAGVTEQTRAGVGSGGAATTGEKKSVSYRVTTLEFLLKCMSPFEILAPAGTFLVAHGFDFNAMFRDGIGYKRASSEKAEKAEDAHSAFRWGPHPRGLLWRMGRAGVPVVVHNGFLDLVLLYTSFHGPLPRTLNGFVCKLLDCVPAGFWDTKLLATGPAEEAVSFLNYVYAHAVTKGRLRVANRKNLPPDQWLSPVEPTPPATQKLCPLYALRGYCNGGVGCPWIHDPFLVVKAKMNGTLPTNIKMAQKLYKKQSKEAKAAIKKGQKSIPKLNKKARAKLVAAENEKKAKGALTPETLHQPPPDVSAAGNTSRKRVRVEDDQDQDWKGNDVALQAEEVKTTKSTAVPPSGTLNTGNSPQGHKERAHSAGWDAFCTGYIFANYRFNLAKEKVDGLHNRINIMKKKSPLWLSRSLFTEPEVRKSNATEEPAVNGGKSRADTAVTEDPGICKDECKAKDDLLAKESVPEATVLR